MPRTTNTTSVEDLNRANIGKLPGHLGLEISVADILCAYGVSTVWPDGATGFATAEVKCKFISTLTEGAVTVSATLLHGGRTTQIWDAAIADEATGRMMAVFRCTQIILYPRA